VAKAARLTPSEDEAKPLYGLLPLVCRVHVAPLFVEVQM
jgi:hypothetical protein